MPFPELRRRASQWATAVSAIGLTLAIFAADTFTSLHIAIAVMYVVPVLLSANFCGRNGILAWGLLSVALTVASFFITHSDTDKGVLGRELVSILAIGTTTILAMRMKTAAEEQKRAWDELNASRAALARITRVVTLGELMASIAHEVNQPLAAIVTNGEACLRWLGRDVPDTAEARLAAERIVSNGRRASDVIQRLRDLAKGKAPLTAPLNVNDVIASAVPLIERELAGSKASLILKLSSQLPFVLGDSVQLQQAIINLALNGIQAMATVPERRRVLEIGTELTPDGLVRVSVKDCGTGIDQKNLDRLFEAFFTARDGGLGLGLSISRSIVEAHGGTIWARNNPDFGACTGFD